MREIALSLTLRTFGNCYPHARIYLGEGDMEANLQVIYRPPNNHRAAVRRFPAKRPLMLAWDRMDKETRD